jgi:AcrR family transcriptional regulator
MDNRETILECALNLFYARGYDAVGVQEIVDQAGVTKPTLYYYFGSKQGLMEEVLHSRSVILEEKLRKAAASEGQITEVLYEVAQVYFDFACTNRRFYLFMLSQFYAGRDTEGFKAVYPVIQGYYELVVKIFEDSASVLGNMRGRQEQFAVSFMGILDSHMMMLMRDFKEEEPVLMSNEKTYEIVHQFLHGIYS